MLTQQPDIAETGPRSLNPIGERRETRALILALEIWLLALLAPLFGARAARAWIASILPATYEEEPSEFTEAEIRLLIPFLWLIGPGRNRGMKPHARTMPTAQPAHARDSPVPLRMPNNISPIRAQNTHARKRRLVSKRIFFFLKKKEAKKTSSACGGTTRATGTRLLLCALCGPPCPP